jgi:predicted dehydrogenase
MEHAMTNPTSTRREFIQKSSAALATASILASSSHAHAEGQDAIRVALIGCGGRGTGAAMQTLTAHPSCKIVALADAFQDRIDSSLKSLTESPNGARVIVPEDHRFVGFDAYKHATDAADVVLLAAPPRFRPDHIAYAVEKGKHMFVEKPVATDAPGLRRVIEACEAAKKKNLTIVSGLCWRYHAPRVETMKRVADGALGNIVTIETVYNAGGVWDPRITREAAKSDMEYQLRNWYYFTWLSGDHIVEQAVHGLDTMGWAMNDDPPAQCWGVGGRQQRTDPKYGNIWDHFSLVYEYANGVRGFHQCRHWGGTPSRVKDFIFGAKGACDVFGHTITGENAWKYEGPDADMYQTEINEFIGAVRSGKRIDDSKRMNNSTMLAIMGRMAAYTGQIVTWDQAMNSQQDLGPATLQWGSLPEPEFPKPGATKLI